MLYAARRYTFVASQMHPGGDRVNAMAWVMSNGMGEEI